MGNQTGAVTFRIPPTRRVERPGPATLGRHARAGHVDALAAKGNALGDQVAALADALSERAVGADNAPPGEIGVVALEEHGAGKARRAWRDIAVGADEARRYLAHAGEDFEQAGLLRSGQETDGPKASMMRFWNSESSSGEMK